MKVFISLPMKGKTDDIIKREQSKLFCKSITYFPNERVEFLNSFIDEEAPNQDRHPGLWYLGKSLEILAEADFAVFAHDWKNARGCEIELKACLEYGIPFVVMEE